MAFRVVCITIVALATSILGDFRREDVMLHSKNGNSPPQKMVEIIELMLSQRPNNSEKKVADIQKVKQNENAGYEILITPNKNFPEAKATQKIKIFVEAENYDEENSDMLTQETKSHSLMSQRKEKQNIFEVLPLSIETAGLNIEDYQKTSIQNQKGYSNSDGSFQKDFDSYPSKRQTNTGTTQKPKQTTRATTRSLKRADERKEVHKTITVSSQEPRTEVYSRNIEATYDNKPRQAAFGLGSTVVLTVNDELPLSANQREPTYVSQSRPQIQTTVPKKAEVVRPLAYDSDNQKSTQNVQGMFSYITPVEEEYEGIIQTRPDVNRPSSSISRNPEPQKQSQFTSNYERPYEEERPVYVKETEVDRPPVNRPQRPREAEDTRTDYKQDQDEEQPNYSYTGSHRPARQDDYSGFPESYEPANSSPFSRPLQYEPSRVFPASPCVQVLKYEGREPEEDRWYADIYASTEEVLIGIRLDITLDRPADLLANWMSEVKTKDNVHFTILSLKKRLVPGPPESIRIMVKFDSNGPVPYINSINLNGRRICPSRSNHGTENQKPVTKRPLYENPADLQTKRTTEYRPDGPKRSTPNFEQEYEIGTTRRPSTHVNQQEGKRTTDYNNRRTTTENYNEQEERKTTSRTTTEFYSRPNPNPNVVYTGTDVNDLNKPSTKKPSRPTNSNTKPSTSSQSRPSTNGNSNSNSNNNNNQQTGSGSSNNRPNTGNTRAIPCGKPSIQPRPLITSGQMTARGQWPWHVALYKNVGADLSYICGGSLISHKHAVTAAHCVTKPYDTKALDANTLVVYLGKYHLKLWSEGGVQNKQVSEVHVHPQYNSTDFRADLAVLVLSSHVDFTDYIRPVCLWDKRSTRIEDIEGKEGTVIGWGFDETKKLTEDLMQAKMPVIKHDVCLWSYPQFFPQFTSNLTYCAGFKNGTSVCNGDSGGGMFFPENDSRGEQQWYIRGLVSISVKQKDTVVCDVNHYIVFTDLAKFTNWLNDFL